MRVPRPPKPRAPGGPDADERPSAKGSGAQPRPIAPRGSVHFEDHDVTARRMLHDLDELNSDIPEIVDAGDSIEMTAQRPLFDPNDSVEMTAERSPLLDTNELPPEMEHAISTDLEGTVIEVDAELPADMRTPPPPEPPRPPPGVRDRERRRPPREASSAQTPHPRTRPRTQSQAQPTPRGFGSPDDDVLPQPQRQRPPRGFGGPDDDNAQPQSPQQRQRPPRGFDDDAQPQRQRPPRDFAGPDDDGVQPQRQRPPRDFAGPDDDDAQLQRQRSPRDFAGPDDDDAQPQRQRSPRDFGGPDDAQPQRQRPPRDFRGPDDDDAQPQRQRPPRDFGNPDDAQPQRQRPLRDFGNPDDDAQPQPQAQRQRPPRGFGGHDDDAPEVTAPRAPALGTQQPSKKHQRKQPDGPGETFEHLETRALEEFMEPTRIQQPIHEMEDRPTTNLDPGERGLLAAIAEGSEPSRLKYADWLQRHGEGARAEYLRVDHELAKSNPADPKFTTLVQRRTELASRISVDWRSRVSRSPIEGCGAFNLPCPSRWAALPADADDVRACQVCRKTVFYCATIQLAQGRVRNGDPVAIDVTCQRWPGDLGGHCVQCNAYVPSEARFCPHCGQSMQLVIHMA